MKHLLIGFEQARIRLIDEVDDFFELDHPVFKLFNAPDEPIELGATDFLFRHQGNSPSSAESSPRTDAVFKGPVTFVSMRPGAVFGRSLVVDVEEPGRVLPFTNVQKL